MTTKNEYKKRDEHDLSLRNRSVYKKGPQQTTSRKNSQTALDYTIVLKNPQTTPSWKNTCAYEKGFVCEQ